MGNIESNSDGIASEEVDAGSGSGETLTRHSRFNFRKSVRKKLMSFRTFSMRSIRSLKTMSLRSLSMRSNSSVRTWSRYSRKPWQHSTLTSLYNASKAAWPVPIYEALFLPEFSIKGAVDESDFEVINVISRGAFGNVYKIKRKNNAHTLAMKVMSKSEVISNDAIQQCKDEVTIQYCLGHHPFIVQVYHYWQSKRNLYIVMEFVSHGELFSLWQRLPVFPEELIRIYVAQLALVLDYLHASGVIYRDMKMENVLVTPQGHLLVTDFGLSKWLTMHERTWTICGTLQYMAPEVLSAHDGGYGHEADWWALGILLYALVAGTFPVYGAHNHLQMLDYVLRCEYPIPHNCSSNMRNLLTRLLCKNPIFRLSCLQSLKYEPLFQNLDFDQIYHQTIQPIDKFPPDFRERYLTEMPPDFADVPSDGQPIRAVPPASLTSPSIPSSNTGGVAANPAAPHPAVLKDHASGTSGAKPSHSEDSQQSLSKPRSRPQSSTSNVSSQHVEPVVLINSQQQQLQHQQHLHQSHSCAHLSPKTLSRTSHRDSSHSHNDVAAGLDEKQSLHQSTHSQHRGGNEQKHNRHQQQQHFSGLTSKKMESSNGRSYDFSSSNPVLLSPSSSPPPRPPLPVASSSSLHIPPPPPSSAKQSDRDHSPTPPPVPPPPASHQALTIQDRQLHRFSASSIGIDGNPSETRVHRRSFNKNAAADGNFVGSRRKHSLRMSCDFELQPSRQQFLHQEQCDGTDQMRKLTGKANLTAGFLPMSSSKTTTTILVDDGVKGEDEDEEIVERCRKDSGINSSSKVSSDADQSSGANVLLSDQEAASGVGGRGDRDDLADDLPLGKRKESEVAKDGDLMKRGSSKERDSSKERSTVSGTSLSSSLTTRTSLMTTTTTRTLMETAFEDDVSDAPALPKKEGKKSKGRLACENGENLASFDSVSSSCTGGVDSGGRGSGYDTRDERRCTDDTSNDTLDEERRRARRGETFVKANSVGVVLRKTSRNGFDDDSGQNGRNGGGCLDAGNGVVVRVFRRGAGGDSFETGSVGDLYGVTGSEPESRRQDGIDGRVKSRSVGNVFRHSSTSQRQRRSEFAEEVEMDFSSESAVRLFQSCCDNDEESHNTALSRLPARQQASMQRTATRNGSRPASQQSLLYLKQQQQRRIVNQKSRESQSSDCISGSSLARANGTSIRDGDGRGGSGDGGISTLSSSRNPSTKSRPYLRLNSDEGPQPPFFSSASASLSRLCSSQEVVGGQHQQPRRTSSQHPRGGGSMHGVSAPKSSVQPSRKDVEQSLPNEESSSRRDIRTARDSTSRATNFVQSPTNVDEFNSKPGYQRQTSDLDYDSRKTLLRDDALEDQHSYRRPHQLQQEHQLRPKESKRRSIQEGSAEPAPIILDSTSGASNSKLNRQSEKKLRPPITCSVPAALPFLSSTTSPPPPKSSALHLTTNASSLDNNAPSSSVVFVSSSSPSSSSFVANTSRVAPTVGANSHHAIVHPTHYHPFSHPDNVPSPLPLHPNLVFSSSYVSEEDLADPQHYHNHYYHRHSRDLPRQYHLSTSSPSWPPPLLTNGFTSAYLLDESADSPSSLFLNVDFSSANDRREFSWRRSLDM